MKRNHTRWVIGLSLWLVGMHNGWSFYNPQTGRWLSRDPLEEQGGLNLFAFAINDPVDLADSDGRSLTYLWSNPSSRNAPLGVVDIFKFANPSTGDNSSAYTLGNEWRLGESATTRTFSGQDKIAVEMRGSPEAREARRELQAKLRKGCRPGMSVPFRRYLGDEPIYVYPATFVADLFVNPSRAFMGSFDGNATVEQCWSCCAVVKFEFRDIKGWKSATHLPRPWGYPVGGENPSLFEKWYAPAGWVGIWVYQHRNGNALTIPSSILPDNAFGKYGRNVTVNVSWKEFLCPYDFPSQSTK